MNAYIVLVSGRVHGVYTSPVDAHLVAKPLLNATVETCRLNSEVLKLEQVVPCEHEFTIESMYGDRSQWVCKHCGAYRSDVEGPVAASASARTPKIEFRQAAGSSA